MSDQLPTGRVVMTPGAQYRPAVGSQDVIVDSGYVLCSNNSFSFADALGFVTVVHPSNQHYGGDEHIMFYKKVSMRKRTASIVPQHDLRNHVGGVITEALVKVYDEIFSCYQHSAKDAFQYADLEVAFKLSVSELMHLGGAAYYPELDLVVSLLNRSQKAIHPNSPVGRIKKLSELKVDTGGSISGGEFFIINEIEEPIGKRYVYMTNRVVEILPTKREDMAGGIYHLLCEGDRFIVLSALDWGSLTSEAEEAMGLYQERSRAAGLGNRKAAFERESAELAQDNARDKVRYEYAKRQQDNDAKPGLESNPSKYLNMLFNIVLTIGFPVMLKKLFDWFIDGATKAKPK